LVIAQDQVWATVISYIPGWKGFLWLMAVLDLFSKNILSLKLSNSLDTEFYVEALEMAMGSGPKPQIFHSGQDCRFTSSGFFQQLRKEEIQFT
jgi:putative transposase